LLELTERGHVTAYFVSRIYVALGKTNETFQWLETAYQEHGGVDDIVERRSPVR
jgi:hypothetical protein